MFQHCGLYFGRAQVDYVKKQRHVEPWRSAWAWLDEHPQVDLPAIAQCSALRYRLLDNPEVGQRAIQILEQDALIYSPKNSIVSIATLMSYAQCFEMLRDHPDFSHKSAWLDQFATLVDEVINRDAGYVLGLWRNSLQLVAAILLEDESQFTAAAEFFEHAIREDLHPEGYIRKAINDGEPGESYYRMLWAVQALILCAEAASHAGRDLWAVNLRGVSVLTPLPYLLYYYYWPEKWRWDAANQQDNVVPEEGQSTLNEHEVKTFFRQHGGLWEMAQRQQYLPDRQKLLEDLRPVFDLWGGGLVTLTHGSLPHRQRRFGLF